MRFVTIEYAGREWPAVLDGNSEDVVLLEAADLVSVIEAGPAGLVAARNELATGERLPLASVSLCAPVRRFRRDVLCTGWNYWDHFEESRGKREGQDVDRPGHPTFFTKGPDVVIGPYDEIAYDPAISAKWDYEAELALVIGKTGRSIPVADALDHVWGYTLANDVSQRDLQRQHGGQWLKGKSIDQTMPLVPADEFGDPQDVHLQCLLNGEVMQDASTKQMAYEVVTRADKIGELRNTLVYRELA